MDYTAHGCVMLITFFLLDRILQTLAREVMSRESIATMCGKSMSISVIMKYGHVGARHLVPKIA